MRKSLLVVLTMLTFCVFSAYAQSTGSSTGAAGDQASTPGSSQSQASTGSGNGGDQTLEGCIVREQTDYYIQPSGGGTPTKLSGSTDVSSHVGHHVVVHGSPSAASSASSSGSATSGQSSDSGAQTFNVTKLEMVSTDCPASAQPNPGSSQDSANPK